MSLLSKEIEDFLSASRNDNRDYVERVKVYATMRFLGHNRVPAALEAGIDIEEADSWGKVAEATPMAQAELARLIEQMKMATVWTPKRAMWELFQIVQDQFEKGSTRLAAIKELNVLSNITFVDAAGNTRVRTLDDFYKEQADALAERKAAEKDAESGTDTQPEPADE